MDILNKRQENIKFFRNPDASVTAAIYQKPVHYEDHGRWADIDNSLRQKTDEKGERYYENIANKLHARFSENVSGSPLASVAMDDYAIEWQLSGALPVQADLKAVENIFEAGMSADAAANQTVADADNIVAYAAKADAVSKASLLKKKDAFLSTHGKHEETLDANYYHRLQKARQKETVLTALSSGVTYPGILKDTDLEYILDGQTVKENIHLLSANAPDQFTFNFRLTGLTPELEANTIRFKNTSGETVLMIRAPYMYDSGHDMTSNVRLGLERAVKVCSGSCGDGDNTDNITIQNDRSNDSCGEGDVWTITLTADKDWLTRPERQWPVIVDPVITTPTSAYEIHDTHVSSGYPTDNFVYSHILKTGNYGSAGTSRSFMSFNLPALKSADMVVAAQMELTCYSENNVQKQVNAHRITQPWDSYTVNWNTKPDYDKKVADYAIFQDTLGKIVSFDITDIVKDWYTNGNNYGIMVKDSTEEGHYTEYLDSDCDNSLAAYRPHILISYVNYSGLEDYWTYHTQQIGRAGTGYVNDYNGNMILTHATASTYGNLMPATLTHVYNSNDKDIDMGYGYGFRLNYHQTLAPVTIGTINYYEYVDEDGTHHYFYNDTEKKKWVDESGIDLTLTIDTASADRYTITDKDDQKLIFNSDGRLAKVMDANGNTLTVTYENGKILSVRDKVGRTLVFTYTVDGLMDKVNGPDGTVSFGYTNGLLTTITDVDNAVVNYGYDGARLMTSVRNIDGYKVNYQYTANAPHRVTSVSESAGNAAGSTTGVTAGQSYTVEYGDNINIITDHKGRKELYMFNNSGNTVSIKNHKGYAQAYKYLTEGSNKNRLSKASKLQYTSVQLLKNPNITSAANWTSHVSAATVTASLNNSAANALVGDKSLKITSQTADGSGYFYQLLNLPKGKDYVFSAHIKADEAILSNQKAFLAVRTKDSTGANNLQYYRTAVRQESGWYLMEAAFTLPANSASTEALLMVGLGSVSGTVYYDCLQLEEGQFWQPPQPDREQ